MNKILIFSGTTEGRMLAQTLSENGIHCIVSVATEYGEGVMPEMDGVTVHKGRMDPVSYTHLTVAITGDYVQDTIVLQ